ncbi:MAG: hypothetical protein WKF79_14965, partial [Nocardioides sp.]
VGVTAVLERPPPRPRIEAQGSVAPTPSPETRRTAALSVLRQWDARRAAAWAGGDVPALRRLYTRGSEAGRRDVSMLRRWVDREWRVQGMQMQILASTVVEESAARVAVRVTDRLTGAVAVGRGRRVVLPGDGATTRQITLRRMAGEWRVAAVEPAPFSTASISGGR